jgi:hypothetical protein
LLAALWPWSFISCVIAWLALLPGSVIVDHFFGVANPDLVVLVLVFSAFGLLLLTIFTGFAYDAQRQLDIHRTLSASRS